MKTLTKAELVTAVAEKAAMSKAETVKFLDALEAVVTETIVGGDAVTVPGIAKVAVKQTAEREVRNPRTGETSTKPAGRGVKVSPVKSLKDAVAA